MSTFKLAFTILHQHGYFYLIQVTRGFCGKVNMCSSVDMRVGHNFTMWLKSLCDVCWRPHHTSLHGPLVTVFSAKTAWLKPLWPFAFVKNIHYSANANHQITKKQAKNLSELKSTRKLIIIIIRLFGHSDESDKQGHHYKRTWTT